MNNNIKIRLAIKEDCKALLKIYEYYVINSAITFEYDVPSLEEIESRWLNITAKYPYLVCLIDDIIVGYAYATDFRHRAAYQWSAESAIYLSHDFLGKGIGKKLYGMLFDTLRLQGYYNVFGGVALPNEGSVNLHLKMGFKDVGSYENIGYKHGKWHTVQWFQLVLNPHIINPSVPKNINEIIGTESFNEILIKANKLI